MDEFDKIREFSEDISKRKEPSFLKDPQEDKPQPEADDDASLYDFKPEYSERLGMSGDDFEEKNFSSMKLHIIALSIFIGVLAIVLIGFFVFGESNENTNEVITINATAEPVKVRPEQPGGMNIPDQDKMVYNRMRSNNVDTKVENLFPEPEQPVMPNILAIENNAPQTDFVPMEEVKKVNPLDEKVARAEPLIQDDGTPKIEEVPLKRVEQMPAPRTQKTVVAASGVWSAQLMSSSNKQTVEKAWPKILAKNKALLSNMSYQITKADIPGKGTFYRLRVGSFKTRDMANALCVKLKARKQDCIPAK